MAKGRLEPKQGSEESPEIPRITTVYNSPQTAMEKSKSLGVIVASAATNSGT